MALIDRLAGRDIPTHDFSAALYLWGSGDFTRQQVVDSFGLGVDDQVQLDQIKAQFDGLTATQKLAYHGKIESLGVLLETGRITEAFYKTKLGMT